jgi:hypothetical protein
LQNPASIIRDSLEQAGGLHGAYRSDLFKGKHLGKVDEGKASETYKDSTQAMGIVSVLIATVTFASAFTLPGGYRSAADSAAGTPVLAGVYAFDAFVVADTLAFLCSSLATFAIVYAGIPAMHHSIRLKYIQFAIILLHGAGRCFIAAFGLGLYLVLAPVDRAAAAVVCVLTFVSLLCGNIEPWQYLSVVNTLRARLGTVRIPAARVHVRVFILWALGYYWSLVLIFILPAVFKWARK